MDWWGTGKMYFKLISKDYCEKRSTQIKELENRLKTDINNEENKNRPDRTKIEQLQKRIDEIEHYKIQGSVIRSKEKMLFNEEKPNKFFFEQEKTKQNKKTINSLTNEEVEIAKNNHVDTNNHHLKL